MCNNTTYVQAFLEKTHQLHLLLHSVIKASSHYTWDMQCRAADPCSCCGLAQSPFSHPVSRAGWPPAVCLHSLAARCCASVLLRLASLLPLVRIPCGALDLQAPATALGNTYQHLKKNLPFGKEFSASSERNPSR